MSSFSSETLHPRARPAPCPSRLCLHRRGSPQTRGQMGTATTYSTARSPLRRGASCVLSDCAHNLSWDGGAIVRYFHCLLLLHARPSRGEQHVVRPPSGAPVSIGSICNTCSFRRSHASWIAAQGSAFPLSLHSKPSYVPAGVVRKLLTVCLCGFRPGQTAAGPYDWLP